MTTTNAGIKSELERANEFRDRHKGKGYFSDQQIEEMCQTIATPDEPQPFYTGKANLMSAIFYINVLIQVRQGTPTFTKHFVGHTGGCTFPGDSLFEGCELRAYSPYTLDDVFSKTTSIEVNAASIFVNILFFDKNSKLLGHLEGGGAGTVIGVSGGTGKWKDGPLATDEIEK